MKLSSYENGTVITFPHPKDLGIDPPEGKELSDFVCWMGFEDKDEPYTEEVAAEVSNVFMYNGVPIHVPITISAIVNCQFTEGQTLYLSSEESNPTQNLNFYPIWESYGLSVQDDPFYVIMATNPTVGLHSYLYPDNYVAQMRLSSISQNFHGLDWDRRKDDFTITRIDYIPLDRYGFMVYTSPNHATNMFQYASNRVVSRPKKLVPNRNICFNLVNRYKNYILNNLYLNRKLFAGIDVTEDYWNEHRNDLYKGIFEDLSSDYIWKKPLQKYEDFNGVSTELSDCGKMFVFPITSCHVSSDGIMYVSCDFTELSDTGYFQMHQSLDGVRSIMTPNNGLGYADISDYTQTTDVVKRLYYRNDVPLSLGLPGDIGLTPPEGKELSDFVCWVGLQDDSEPYQDEQILSYATLSTSPTTRFVTTINTIFLSDDLFSMSAAYQNVNFYAVWDSYAWSNDMSGWVEVWNATNSSNHYIEQGVFYRYNYRGDNSIRQSGKSLGGPGGITSGLGLFGSQRVEQNGECGQYTLGRFIPGYCIRFAVVGHNGATVNNIYLNKKLFAGVDITEDYWNEHQKDLYLGFEPSLSSNVIWSEPVSTIAKGFIFPITSCHVSSDNVMHITCD